MVDLHTHSCCSDGTCTPEQIVHMAAHTGLHGVALTDHDTVDGNDTFVAAGRAAGLPALAGVEISAEYVNPETGRAGDGEMHILGYFPAWSPDTVAALAPLAEIRRNRAERNPKIIARLRELGFDISYDEVQRLADNNVVGRPHIAAVMLKKGFVRSTKAAFDRYLGRAAPAYVAKEIFAPQRAVGLIAEAGGVAVLAHPRMLGISSAEMLRNCVARLVEYGLAGIEVYYTVHLRTHVEQYRALARAFDLVMTGGSDFHGRNKPDIRLGTALGSLHVPDECLAQLLARTDVTK
jgi:predicted metal-dependent phosphoesterase TrpH